MAKVVAELQKYAKELKALESQRCSREEPDNPDDARLQELLGRHHVLEDQYAQVELEGLEVLHQHAVVVAKVPSSVARG